MPELPEVETICRGLAQHCVGAKVLSVRVMRPQFIRGSINPADLFSGLTIERFHRHGKQFCLESTRGRVLLFHMGMSGSVTLHPFQSKPAPHVHVLWTLSNNGKIFEMHHKDPRRFGYVRAYENMQFVREIAWFKLGPDALSITANELFLSLNNSRRRIKTILLDQSIIAGVGNIYADESLFRSKIHPLRKGSSLTRAEINQFIAELKLILKQAIRCGGSTIQSHADALGNAGTYQATHLVYGRGKEPCTICGALLKQTQCSQRTTVYCSVCQPRNSKTHRL